MPRIQVLDLDGSQWQDPCSGHLIQMKGILLHIGWEAGSVPEVK